MLSEIAIAEIDKLLDLCDSYLLNQLEIEQLNKLEYDPLTECEYYETTQVVLTNRSKTDTSQNVALEMLVAYAVVDGCPLDLEPELIPEVDIPIFGGSV